MNIKGTLKHMWFGTKVLAVIAVVTTILYFVAAFTPWLLVGIAMLWVTWFIGFMLS